VPVPDSIVTEHEVAGACDLGQVQRDRVVGAEHPTAALQDVLAQDVGRLDLAHCIMSRVSLLAAVRVSGWSGPRTSRQRSSSCALTARLLELSPLACR